MRRKASERCAGTKKKQAGGAQRCLSSSAFWGPRPAIV